VAGAANVSPHEAVVQSARNGEPDRYLAALLAPPAARSSLLALAAFASELTRVGAAVTREPVMGEVRLQWWRDALQPTAGRTGNPIADALTTAGIEADLPRELLLEAIEGHGDDLDPQPLENDADLRVHLWRVEGTVFALGARVLNGRRGGSDPHPAAESAGHAYGLARLLLGLPHALSRGRQPLPRSRLATAGLSREALLAGSSSEQLAGVLAGLHAEARKHLKEAKDHVAKLPREMRVAYLPLALVEPYLRALERPGRDVLRTPADVAPLTRACRIAAAHWLGRA
jgi:15-cis-phytoene synthase